MAFHEVRFPTDISYGSRGGPGFNTSVVILGSAYEQRNINWEKARCKYDVAYGVKTGPQLLTLITFFRARFGKAHGFRYKDWSDYQSVAGPTTVITTKIFQILKRYTSTGYDYDRELKKIVTGTLTVYANGVAQTTECTTDLNTGIITFAPNAPTQPVTATCEFDVPVRFDTDELSSSLDAYAVTGNYFGGTTVPLIEIKI